jgi:outer membrane protein
MRLVLPLAAMALIAQVAQGQSAASLTLDEAISLARRNNPLYLQTVNQRRSADAQKRTAFAFLLPSVNANASGRYQESGQQFVSGVALANNSDLRQSSYGLSVNYTINSDILFAPRQASANQDAAEADVTGQTEFLRAAVTQQYLLVLQSQARAALQDTLVQVAKAQLELAKAKQDAGSGTILEVRRAEVAHGQAEVAQIQAKNNAEVEMLRLFQQLGVSQPENVTLTTRFTITPVNFRVDSLLEVAQARNPGLVALRYRERAANLTVHGARGRYLPTFNLSTSWGGQSQQFVNEGALIRSDSLSTARSFSSCSSFDSIRVGSGLSPLGCGVAFDPTAAPSRRGRSASSSRCRSSTTCSASSGCRRR